MLKNYWKIAGLCTFPAIVFYFFLSLILHTQTLPLFICAGLFLFLAGLYALGIDDQTKDESDGYALYVPILTTAATFLLISIFTFFNEGLKLPWDQMPVFTANLCFGLIIFLLIIVISLIVGRFVALVKPRNMNGGGSEYFRPGVLSISQLGNVLANLTGQVIVQLIVFLTIYGFLN